MKTAKVSDKKLNYKDELLESLDSKRKAKKKNKRHASCVNDNTNEPPRKKRKLEGIYFKSNSFLRLLQTITKYIFIEPFCIGVIKNMKKVVIRPRSKYVGLCGTAIASVIKKSELSAFQLTLFRFCLVNYQCTCNVSKHVYESKLSKFTLPQNLNIPTSKEPKTSLVLIVNDEIVENIYVKTTAASNLKRMSQPQTFEQYRVSISTNIRIFSTKLPQLILELSQKTGSNDNFGVGVGYYINNNRIDLILALTSLQQTQFQFLFSDDMVHGKIKSIKLNLKNDRKNETIFQWRVDDNYTEIPILGQVSPSLPFANISGSNQENNTTHNNCVVNEDPNAIYVFYPLLLR